MRFLSIYKNVERNTPPTPEEMARMGKVIEEGMKAGYLLATEGCMPTALGACVRRSEGNVTVTDGPFTEAKEVVGGYAIFDARSKAHMLKWTERFMNLHKIHMPGWEGECEVRQIPEVGQEPCGQTHETQAAAE